MHKIDSHTVCKYPVSLLKHSLLTLFSHGSKYMRCYRWSQGMGLTQIVEILG